jgi:hypothetical protein
VRLSIFTLICSSLLASPLLTQAAATSAIAKADHALTMPIVTIVQKPAPSPTGNAHDYISYARYWWPNPDTPDHLPYIQKDGHHNLAQVHLGDEPRLGQFSGPLQDLAQGWAATHRAVYAQRAGEWLRAWFIDPATFMTPNLEYSQIQMGRNHNHGNGTGVLDGRAFVGVADSINLLQGSPALSPADWAAVKKWYADYLNWLLTSTNAKKEHAAPNNHGSWYLVTTIAVAEFCGRNDIAQQLAEEDRARIAHQIRPDGSQPEETRRQDGLGYSVFNLQAQLEICRRVAPLGVQLFRYQPPDAGSLLTALNYLKPYNTDPKKWPGNQHNPEKAHFLDKLVTESEGLQ